MDLIQVVKGDITQRQVDAVVNAANSSLMGGGGVDGAIHRAGGPEILEECREIVRREGQCATGEAVITTAGRMPAKYVVHTVGPVWQGGDKGEKQELYSAYYNSLGVALSHGCTSVAFPNISTGVYGYPKAEAAKTAVKAVRDFLSRNQGIHRVELVCFDQENYELTRKELQHPDN